MPFTPAHAVAAIPFRQTSLSSSALVIGCLSPDFEYFLRLAAQGSAGHTISGLFWFDLPLSLVVLWLWHRFVAVAVSTLAPGLLPVEETGMNESPLGDSPGRFALICGSILIGAATHLLWDSFTHPIFWPYSHVPLLRATLHIGSMQIPVYKSFQHGSTVLGMSILALMWVRWRQDKPRDMPTLHPAGWLILCVAMIAAVSRVLTEILFLQRSGGSSTLASAFIVTWIAALWVSLVIFGWLQTSQRCWINRSKTDF